MASALRHWPRILMRGFRIIGWSVCALAGLALLGLGFILSPTGSAWLLDKARSQGYLSYDRVEGAPLDHWVLEGVRLPLGTSELQATRLELRWATNCLLKGRVCLDELKGQGIHFVVGPSAEETPASTSNSSVSLARIKTPIPVEVRSIVLDDVSLEMATGMTASWRHLSTGVRMEGSLVTLSDTLLGDTQVTLAPSAKSEPAPLPSTSVTPATRAPLTNPLAGLSVHPLDLPASRIQLPNIALPVDVDVPSIVIEHVDIAGLADPLRIDHIDLGLHARDTHIVLDHLHYRGPDADVTAAADVQLTGEYPLALSLDGSVHHAPLQNEQIALRIGGSLAALNVQLEGREQIALKVGLKADLLSQLMPFSASVSSPRLQWPLTENERRQATAIYRLDGLDAQAEGDLTGYQLRIDGTVRSNTLKPMPIHLAGHGDDHQFAWSALNVGVGSKGGLQSQGYAQWAPLLMAKADVTLDQLQVDALAPTVPGVLSGQTHVEFQQHEDASWAVQVPSLALNGTLMKQPLTLNGRLEGDSGFHWTIHALNLRQGRNQLQAQGVIADKSDLHATVDAPMLSTLWPGLGGRLQGQVDINGPLTSPRGRIELHGEQLRYGAHQLQHLALKGSGSGTDDPDMDVVLEANGVKSGTLSLRSVAMTLKGRLSQHRLNLAVDGQKSSPLTNARLVLEGGLDTQRHRYHGRVTPLSIDATQVGQVALNGPLVADIDLDTSSATVQPFCLVRAQGGRLCAEKVIQASADHGQAQLMLDNLPMAMLNSVMPAPWRVSGSTQGKVDARWSSGGTRWNANADISNGVTVTGKDADGRPYSLPALATHLQLDATPDKARLQTQMTLKNAGQLRADIGISDPLVKRQLSGLIKIDQLLLSPYRPLVAGIDSLDGALNGQIGLAGTLQHPQLEGQLVLGDVKAKGAILPIALDDARIALNFHGEQGQIEGYLASGNSRLLLNGSAQWPLDAPWRVAMTLRDNGTPLEIAALDYGRVKVSPHIDLTATPDLLSIEGTVDVPWARIEVAQLPPSVQTPSSDEVILTRDEAARLDRVRAGLEKQNLSRERRWADAAALQKAGMGINLNVRVNFGKDVHLAAYGLNSNITGAFDVRQRQNAIQLFGTIALKDGRYKAFGQDLIIQKGEISFTGPAAQPRLDIVAIRNPDSIEDNVTAGVKVTGTALSPNIQVFSDPAMNETSALSYLLQGHASDSGSNDNALTSALIGLSIAQSGSTVGAIGETFGIQDLTLDTAGTGDNSQVVVSGYVLPRLKVSYGVGVFTPIAELTLRYRLMQNLYLQGVSGASQALDLIYTFSLGRTPDTLPSDAVKK